MFNCPKKIHQFFKDGWGLYIRDGQKLTKDLPEKYWKQIKTSHKDIIPKNKKGTKALICMYKVHWEFVKYE